jgi:hypothetical protein
MKLHASIAKIVEDARSHYTYTAREILVINSDYLTGQSAHKWRPVCQAFTPAALYFQKYFYFCRWY